MERSRLVAGLLELKSELLANHADLLKQLGKTVKDINAVSRVISQCDKDAAYMPIFPPRPYKAYFAPGELLALIANVLKTLPDGISSKELAERIRKIQTEAERELPTQLEESIKEALRRMLQRKTVERIKLPSNRTLWALSKRDARQGGQAAEGNAGSAADGVASAKVTPLRR